MGLTGMVFSTIAIAAGAVMYWGVTTQANGFRIGTVGVILMIVGAAGLVVSSIVFAASRRRAKWAARRFRSAGDRCTGPFDRGPRGSSLKSSTSRSKRDDISIDEPRPMGLRHVITNYEERR